MLRNKIWTTVTYLVYFWTLAIIYHSFVPHTFSFWQYSTENIEPLRFFVASVLVCGFALLMPTHNCLSTLLLHLQLCLPVIPMLVIFACGQWYTHYVLIALLGFLVALMVVRMRITLPFILMPIISMNRAVWLLLFLAVVCVVALIYFLWQHFNLDLARVYEVRSIVDRAMPSSLKYVLFGVIPVVLSTVAGYGITSKKWHMVFLPLIIFPVLFAFTSHRQFLLAPALIVFVFLAVSIKPYFVSVPALCAVTLLFAFLTDILITNIWMKALLLDRLFFVPAQATFMHYEFFNTHPHLFWCDSPWLSPATQIFYPSCPYFLGNVWETIGKNFFTIPVHLNTSWLGSGYSHAGVPGMIIYGLLVGVLFNYLDTLSVVRGRFFTAISFAPMVVGLLLSSDLKTVFLTNGLLFYLLIMSIVKNQKQA